MSGRPIAVVEAGPIVAAANRKDRDHPRSVQALQTPGLRLIYPALVLAEALYFIQSRLGTQAELQFLDGVATAEVESPLQHDWKRIIELVTIYRAFPLGGVDASVVALAERLNTDLIITLDRRHFAAVRPRHVAAFRLLPE